MLSPADLAAIRARANAASPGPWRALGSDRDILGPEGPVWTQVIVSTDVVFIEDAAFIAASRVDVPVLLDEVERLRAEIEAIYERIEERRINSC